MEFYYHFFTNKNFTNDYQKSIDRFSAFGKSSIWMQEIDAFGDRNLNAVGPAPSHCQPPRHAHRALNIVVVVVVIPRWLAICQWDGVIVVLVGSDVLSEVLVDVVIIHHGANLNFSGNANSNSQLNDVDE